jgi:hypothetical protein
VKWNFVTPNLDLVGKVIAIRSLSLSSRTHYRTLVGIANTRSLENEFIIERGNPNPSTELKGYKSKPVSPPNLEI